MEGDINLLTFDESGRMISGLKEDRAQTASSLISNVARCYNYRQTRVIM